MLNYKPPASFTFIVRSVASGAIVIVNLPRFLYEQYRWVIRRIRRMLSFCSSSSSIGVAHLHTAVFTSINSLQASTWGGWVRVARRRTPLKDKRYISKFSKCLTAKNAIRWKGLKIRTIRVRKRIKYTSLK